MPQRYRDEFRQPAIELTRIGDKPVAHIAADLGIATSCLRRWMKQDDIDGGRRDGLNTDERAELVRLRRELRTANGERDSPTDGHVLRQGDAAGPKMTYTFIARACADLPVAACCRVMRVSTSGVLCLAGQPGAASRISTTPISATPSSTSGP